MLQTEGRKPRRFQVSAENPKPESPDQIQNSPHEWQGLDGFAENDDGSD
jgi:hypothetical protein